MAESDNLLTYGLLGLAAYFIYKRTQNPDPATSAAPGSSVASPDIRQGLGLGHRYPGPVIGTVYDPGGFERLDYAGASKQLPQGQSPGQAPPGWQWFTPATGTPLSIVTWTLQPAGTPRPRVNPRLIM